MQWENDDRGAQVDGNVWLRLAMDTDFILQHHRVQYSIGENSTTEDWGYVFSSTFISHNQIFRKGLSFHIYALKWIHATRRSYSFIVGRRTVHTLTELLVQTDFEDYFFGDTLYS